MKRAYATVLCGGDGYLPGVEVLGQSLVASGSDVPRLALITRDVGRDARQRLHRQGWEIREIEPISNPSANGMLFPRFGPSFTKLRAWEVEGIDRLVLLDADTLVLRNIDDLFERHTFAAAPDYFLPDRFNSGVMVLEPSRETFIRMYEALPTTASYDGGDQGFLNAFFNWYALPIEHRLPATYNMPHFNFEFLRQHLGLTERVAREVRILHYMLQKPWLSRAMVTGGSALWWSMYYQAHPEEAASWRHLLHGRQDWAFDQFLSLLMH